MARPHADRLLHGQDFSTHVAAVRQATVGGIWLVGIVVELFGQVKEPAPRSQRMSTECDSARMMLRICQHVRRHCRLSIQADPSVNVVSSS